MVLEPVLAIGGVLVGTSILLYYRHIRRKHTLQQQLITLTRELRDMAATRYVLDRTLLSNMLRIAQTDIEHGRYQHARGTLENVRSILIDYRKTASSYVQQRQDNRS